MEGDKRRVYVTLLGICQNESDHRDAEASIASLPPYALNLRAQAQVSL